MPTSEAQRRATTKWHRENMTKLGCSVRKEKADAFKIACHKLGLVPNAVFLKVVDEIIEKSNIMNEKEGD